MMLVKGGGLEMGVVLFFVGCLSEGSGMRFCSGGSFVE